MSMITEANMDIDLTSSGIVAWNQNPCLCKVYIHKVLINKKELTSGAKASRKIVPYSI